MNESGYKRKIVKFLKELGYKWVYCPRDMFKSGVPDILTAEKNSSLGKTIAIELKIKGNEPTPIQIMYLKTMKTAGCNSVIIYIDPFNEYNASQGFIENTFGNDFLNHCFYIDAKEIKLRTIGSLMNAIES